VSFPPVLTIVPTSPKAPPQLTRESKDVQGILSPGRLLPCPLVCREDRQRSRCENSRQRSVHHTSLERNVSCAAAMGIIVAADVPRFAERLRRLLVPSFGSAPFRVAELRWTHTCRQSPRRKIWPGATRAGCALCSPRQRGCIDIYLGNGRATYTQHPVPPVLRNALSPQHRTAHSPDSMTENSAGVMERAMRAWAWRAEDYYGDGFSRSFVSQ